MATVPQKPAAATTSEVKKPPYTSPIPPKRAGTNVPRGNQTFLFDRSNYIWMAVGLACILLGFMLMSGGKSPDPHKFLYDEIYSFRRITLAPFIILVGFGIEAYAIMKRRDDAPSEA